MAADSESPYPTGENLFASMPAPPPQASTTPASVPVPAVMLKAHEYGRDPREWADKLVAQGIQMVLEGLGYDLQDQNFKDTPQRVMKFLAEFRKHNPDDVEKFCGVSFPETYDELILIRDISTVSLCAHHMLPFVGVAHVGYIPKKGVLGLSKLARIVHFVSRQLTLQEAVTRNIADAIEKHVDPLGVIVLIESSHQCMTVRGVKEPNAVTITSAIRGVFKDPQKGARDEFLRLVGRGK